MSLGEIVSFIGFAGLLIARLDQITGFAGRLFIQAPTVDAFFERVTVNAEDPALRANRLALLNALRAATRAVADFSRIEG